MGDSERFQDRVKVGGLKLLPRDSLRSGRRRFHLEPKLERLRDRERGEMGVVLLVEDDLTGVLLGRFCVHVSKVDVAVDSSVALSDVGDGL